MKRLVLTFDDGPDAVYTRKILDILKDESIKATFFVVASNAAQHPALISRMQAEGHCIALHSLEHRHALFCSYQYMKHDFSKSLEILNNMNCKINFYRPPWGVRNPLTRMFMKKHQLKMILWNVMVGDWKADFPPEKLADKILKKVFDGAILCLHDGCEKYGGAKGAPFNTIDALKLVLPKLKQEGYRFVTVEEFFNYA